MRFSEFLAILLPGLKLKHSSHQIFRMQKFAEAEKRPLSGQEIDIQLELEKQFIRKVLIRLEKIRTVSELLYDYWYPILILIKGNIQQFQVESLSKLTQSKFK